MEAIKLTCLKGHCCVQLVVWPPVTSAGASGREARGCRQELVGVAAALPMPVTDELRRGNWTLGFSHCPSALLNSPSPALLVAVVARILLCSLIVNYLSPRRKTCLPYSKNLWTPNKHWPVPTRTKRNFSRRLGSTTLSLSSDSSSPICAKERRYHQQQHHLGQRCRGASRAGREHPRVLPAGC